MFETAMFLELLEKVRDLCHQNSKDKGFWGDNVHPTAPWNFGEKIALLHTEISEMFEAWRKDKKESDKDIRIIDPACRSEEDPVGTRRITAIEEEVADTFIRLMDLCGRLDVDVGRVVLAKMHYNRSRPHMHGGRKC